VTQTGRSMAHKGMAVAEWRSHWTLPIAAALGYTISVLHLYSIGPFIEPLQHEFGWSRVHISMGITIVGLAGAALSVPVGMLIDRLGPRPVALTGALLMTATFAMLATASSSSVHWFLLWGLVALGNLGLQATGLTSAVASRFEASRGLAFALTLSGGSLGAALHPVLASWLIDSYGWRTAFAGMGGFWALLALPLMFVFFRGAQDGRRRERVTIAPVRTLSGVSVRDALRSLTFYKLALASGLLTFTNVGIIVHFVPILTDRGATALGAAQIASLIGIFSIFGRLGAGLLLDRCPGHIVGAGVFCMPIVACVLLLSVDGANPLSQAVAAACFGITVGAEVDVIAYLASRHFGLKNFGVLFGVIISALTLGVAFGPLAAGAAFDWYGSYSQFLALTIAFMVASCLALGTLPRLEPTAELPAMPLEINK
jgi:MFS family permease